MIKIIKVKNNEQGNQKAHDILKKVVDEKTLLALSGGTSPDYRKMIVKPPRRQGYEGQAQDILPGAICVVDERYGKPFHSDSNELLLKEHGIKEFADNLCIESHKILKGKSFLETANLYEKEIKDLYSRFKKRVGVMGVGANLHTAGIFPYSQAVDSEKLVVAEEVEDKFPKRITLTFKALKNFTAFIVLVFGQEKKEVLKIILDKNQSDIQKYPAVFYRKTKAKVFVITDIKIQKVVIFR